MKIKDNNAKASINFQKANMKVAPFHNAREAFVPQSSHAELASKNECSCSALAAVKKIQKWDEKADQNYAKNHGGRRSPVKETSKVWEAVVNLRENHTMADVKKLVKKLEEKTGYKAAQIAIHRDEGHVSDDGDFIQNIHAHILFYARDPKTGLSLSTKYYGDKKFFEEIQDITASELGMERGRSARETGAKHENMHSYKARKQAERAERTQNKEWEAKLEANNKAWQEKQAAWEQKQAEREARKEEWERKLPEIMAARERRSKFISEQLDWESARTGKMLARDMELLGLNFAGINNPHGNPLLEAQKDAIRNVFKMLGATAQLAVFMFNKTIINDEKIKSDIKIYNVESTLLRAVDYVANSDEANGEELKKLIRRKLMLIPEDKRRELFEYAIENAPTEELRNDIKALIEGRFSDIAKSEQAQKRIENRDLRAELKAYGEEIRKIRDELKQMDEENRILNLAERAILREKGATRDEYAEQEAQNRERLNDLKQLKDEQKAIKKAIDEQKQPEQKDAQTIRELTEQIAELNKKIAEITAENVAKQRELEAEKAARKTAEIISPKMLEAAFEKIDELEEKLKQREEPKPEKIEPEPEQKPKDAFDIIDELEAAEKAKQPEPKPEPIREEPKIEQKPEPEPKPETEQKPEPKKDDNLNIYGYKTYTPEPRRRFGDEDFKPRPREIDDRPKYVEPEPVKPEPEKIEPEPFRDPWQKIENEIEKWKKCESEVEKKMLSPAIIQKIDEYEKSGWDIPLHRQMSLDSYRRALAYDPAEAVNRERERRLEEQKRREAAELEKKKYEEAKKNVKQEADAKQRDIKKKKKEELEMGIF